MVTIRKIILSVLFIVVLSVLVFAAVTEADAHTGNRRTSTNFANCVNFGGDLDGDFICDGWEPPHAGGSTFDVIVTFPNGIPSYVYKCGRAGEPVCPTETSKDILVEVDCTNSGQCPSADAINLVRNAFSTQSITLHVQVDANDLASSSGHSDTVRWPGTNMSPGFDQIKRMHFGTAAERSDVNGDGTPDPGVWDNTGWNQKKQIFHYAIFAKFQFGNPSSSGIGETHGNDFMVTLGNWAGTVGSVEEQAGTLMHELGHNLNLQHGGSDTINCKPNYLSVMSYSRQMPDLVPTRKVGTSARGTEAPPTTPATGRRA